MPLNNTWGIIRPANPLWNIWGNDKKLLELYKKRCRQEIEEMTCADQLATLIIKNTSQNDTFMDVGCGGAYYYVSLKNRGFQVPYFGIDYTPQMIDLAQEEIGKKYLHKDHFRLMSIEDLDYSFDNIICFHVLTNTPHYLFLLDRMLSCTKKNIFIRENISNKDSIETHYAADPYIDEEKRHMHVYHNLLPLKEIIMFCKERGFNVTEFLDNRTKGKPEIVCDIPHTWKILKISKI